MTEKKNSFWTLRYTLLNITYFAAFCTIHAYAAVYLLSCGFTNTEVGILLALANITSAICQPLIAGKIDGPGPLSNRGFILFSVTAIMCGSVLLMILPANKLFIFVIYAFIYMIQFAYQPVMTALCFEYQKAGCSIYYGLARGMGSAGFALTSAFIGRIVEKSGSGILLWVNIISMILSAIIILFFKKPDADNIKKSDPSDPHESENGANTDSESPSGKIAHNGFISFTKTYPSFMLFLAGTICFFFAHNMINDFMIQIIRNLGGGEAQLGYANFLQAILELPVMALIGFVLKKITSDKLLLLSGVAFLVKILILVFAGNMTVMYLSQSFQLFAYAVFIPAAAYYVSENMQELDQVKGQAYVTSAITLGGVFSNLLSGVILDNAGIRAMLLTGSAVCAAGVIIAFMALGGKKHAS